MEQRRLKDLAERTQAMPSLPLRRKYYACMTGRAIKRELILRKLVFIDE
jgi:hypothetical protein